jgi:hypothetical protein
VEYVRWVQLSSVLPAESKFVNRRLYNLIIKSYALHKDRTLSAQFIKLDGSALVYSSIASLQDQLPLVIQTDAVMGVRDFRSEQL